MQEEKNVEETNAITEQETPPSLPVCEHCENTIEDDEIKSDGRTTICQSCYENYYFTCEGRNTINNNDDLVVINDSEYCQDYVDDHFLECPECNEYVHDGYGYSVWHRGDEQQRCEKCWNENAIECNDCLDCHSRDNTYFHEEDDCDYCSDCYEKHNETRVIKDYSYKPEPKRHDVEGHNNTYEPISPTFGVEFEYHEFQSNYIVDEAKDFLYENPFFYFKHDGSLKRGVEVVTHPFTKARYLQNIELFKTMLTYIKINKGTTDNNTGIHIHIGRSQINDIIVPLYNFINDERNQKYLEKIAGRMEGEWCAYHKKKEPVKELPDHEPRGSSLNLKPDNTVELRLFRSAYTPVLALGRIEWTLSLIDRLNMNPSCTTHECLTVYQYNTTEYPTLKEFLERKRVRLNQEILSLTNK